MSTIASHASFARRALALLIDVPIAFGVAMAFAMTVVLPWAISATLAGGSADLGEESVARLALQALCLAAVFSYFAVFESSRWQGTPGKRVMGLRVTSLDGQRISFRRSCARNLLKGFSTNTVGMGYWRFFLSDRGQTFHDNEAGTLVVRVPRVAPPSLDARGTGSIRS